LLLAAHFDHDFNRIRDALPRIADRRWRLGQGESVRVDQQGVEPLLRDESGGSMRRALPFAADPEYVRRRKLRAFLRKLRAFLCDRNPPGPMQNRSY